MRCLTSALCLALAACHAVAEGPPAVTPSPPGRVDTFQLSMPELKGRERTIRVYLPPAYESSRASFPVLYLQDGQQLFSQGPFGDWRIDESMDSLVAAGRTRGVIVVGIDNSEHRWDEYGPWVNARMHDWVSPSWANPAEGGDAAAYVRFLSNTLKPEIDRRYRTRRGRADTGIGGSSMGGLLALYAGLTRPDVFSKVMAMSTAVWFAEDGGVWLSRNAVLTFLGERPAPQNVRFYIDIGTNERSRDTEPDVVDATGRGVGYPRAYLEGSRAVAEALRASGVPTPNLELVVEEDAIHHEGAWARRFPNALLWLYR